jgi:hypothetical protein
MELLNCRFASRVAGGQWESKVVAYIRQKVMKSKVVIVTSAADGCGKPSSIRPMDNSNYSNMEQENRRFLMFGKTHFSILMASAVASLAMLSAGNAQANLILNGDFSANASSYTTFPGYSSSPNPSNPADWVVSAPANAGVNGPDTGFYASQGEPFAPASTTGVTDFAFMQGGQIFQTVTTTAGQAYTLTYDAGARSGTPSTLNTVAYDQVNSVAITTQVPNISDSNFALFTLDFTAASNSTTIAFQDTGGTPDFSNVSLTPVPDPATLGLSSAVGSLGLLLLKRRKAV